MPKKTKAIIPTEAIASKIIMLRGERVILDRDLAEMYGVETRVLKQAVRRNIDRFPDDFMFELTKKEQDFLRSQYVTLKRGQHSKYPPFAFTEQGVAMLSSVLNSDQAIKVAILSVLDSLSKKTCTKYCNCKIVQVGIFKQTVTRASGTCLNIIA